MSKLSSTGKLGLFATLSLGDLVLTWTLVRQGQGCVYEGNPVAGWWLAAFGWTGLAAFKTLMVLVVGSLALLISRSRPWHAGFILNLACSAVALVLTYSCVLEAGVVSPPTVQSEEEEMETFESAHLEADLHNAQAYQKLANRLVNDLIGRRCALLEAVDQLAETAQASDPAWLEKLHVFYPDCSDREALAASLLLSCYCQVQEDRPAARQLARRLVEEFESTFGAPVPENCLMTLPAERAERKR